MIENKPKITVVTVCYNAVKEIERTMLSVLNQTYPNIEYIIIDGASTDGTVDVIKKYADRLAFWVSEPDKGIYDAMNKGIEHATGEWINFMNAGDSFYDENIFDKVFNSVDKDTIVVYGRLAMVNYGVKYLTHNTPLDENFFAVHSCMPHQASFIRMEYQRVNFYDTTLKSASDYKFFFNALFKDRCKFQYLPIVIANFNMDEGMSKKISTILEAEDLHINGQWKSTRIKVETYIRAAKLYLYKIMPQNVSRKLYAITLRKHGYEIVK